MSQTDSRPVKVAILDLYNGIENEGMRGFREILERFKAKNNLNLSYEVFDVRKKVEVPGTEFDIYISSGGPGSPIDSEGTEWEKKYFNLIDKLEDHNLSHTGPKKFGFFVCHAFQLMCRKYQLGYSQHAGMVVLADGTDRAATCLKRVLYNDPAMGIFRHDDAGYDKAKEWAEKFDLKVW